MERPKKATAIRRLQNALDKIPELKRLRYNSPKFEKWNRDTRIVIINTFGDESNHKIDFMNIIYFSSIYSSPTFDLESQESYEKGLDSAGSVLESMIDEIQEYWEEDKEPSSPPYNKVKILRDTNKVFVVHGHDDGTKQKVARFLERLDLEPVVLHEQPSKGHTVIEKFEDHSDVGFAVVLLTPDDVGAIEDRPDDLKPRARQNVVFELGYFVGALGREKVCALAKGNIERPSDYDGVVYIPLDNGDGWRMKLVKELKAAGFDVDANKAI